LSLPLSTSRVFSGVDQLHLYGEDGGLEGLRVYRRQIFDCQTRLLTTPYPRVNTGSYLYQINRLIELYSVLSTASRNSSLSPSDIVVDPHRTLSCDLSLAQPRQTPDPGLIGLVVGGL
jgi:hypothetical protein